MRVTIKGTQGALDSLRIREITRRRGVGQYLVEEVIRENPEITSWVDGGLLASKTEA